MNKLSVFEKNIYNIYLKTSRNKKAMNDPRVKAAWVEVEEASTHAENTLKDWYKKNGLEYPG